MTENQATATRSGSLNVTRSTEEIIDVLAAGRATPGYLVDQTGLSRNTVHTQLTKLMAGGYVVYVHEPTGLYELVADPREDDNDSEGDT